MTALESLPAPWGDETQAVAHLTHLARECQAAPIDWPAVQHLATPWLTDLRAHPPAFWAMESLLQSYPLSSAQGLALMRLAEALLRVPDADTVQLLLSDQLAQGDFAHAQTPASHAHPWWDAMSSKVLALAQDWMQANDPPGVLHGLLQQWGQAATVSATLKAVQLLGHQFVLAPDIAAAWRQARITFEDDAQHHWQTRWSFDMLGEGARTWPDADRYFAAYEHALNTLADAGSACAGQGLSVKLSALHPRFEVAHVDSVTQHLRPRLLQLARLAAHHGLQLTLDAEESDRLTLQAELLQGLVDDLGADPALAHWRGLGLAVQAYQLRAPALIDSLVKLARRSGRQLTVRLVKGAYWDGEIKRAQTLGLPGYPVYTRKAHTDLSYLACARLLLAHTEHLYPQFATHNAVTIAAVMTMARQAGIGPDRYEWQRLHGMGAATYHHIRQHVPSGQMAPVRVYAPVGPHRDLLAYLVRRLLENGANSAFVHQLADPTVPLQALLHAPWQPAPGQPPLGTPGLPLPAHAWGGEHPQAAGRDLSHGPHLQALLAAVAQRKHDSPLEGLTKPGHAPGVSECMLLLHQAWPDWEAKPVVERAHILTRVADHLTEQLDSWVADLVVEAHKTLADAVAEVRETIDFARYYAAQAQLVAHPRDLPAPTGETNQWRLRGRGVFVCIAPWNFPLAIFGGQLMAALVMGNTVAAKSAPQTPRVAERLVRLLHACGVPPQVLIHVPGDAAVGAALVAHPWCAGVAFTGSVAAAKRIQLSLAAAERPIVPFIAETGGINAMVVDSTALPEQVLDAVVQSAFHSAGQRCSALRLLCLHTAVADGMERMLAGAMQTLRVGLPEDVSTDVGPVIDEAAAMRLGAWVSTLEAQAAQTGSGVAQLARAPGVAAGALLAAGGWLHWVVPTVFRLPGVAHLSAEHFGPVLHVVHWGPGTSAASLEVLLDQIHASGFGLTLGLQTRIDGRVQQVVAAARVGNVYVNRGMTGAVVGAQPFGGQGLSGSGPKAGGPLYLARFGVEQVVSVNTAAAGGNVGLLAGTQ